PIEVAHAAAGEMRRINRAPLRVVTLADQGDQVLKVLDAFATAEINTEARAINLLIIEQLRIGKGLMHCAESEARVSAAVGPTFRILDIPAQIQVLYLGGEARGEVAGVEERNGTDAAAAFDLGLEQIVHGVTERGDSPHAGNNDASSHKTRPSSFLAERYAR